MVNVVWLVSPVCMRSFAFSPWARLRWTRTHHRTFGWRLFSERCRGAERRTDADGASGFVVS